MNQMPPMMGPGDWRMPGSGGSPGGSNGHPGMGCPGMDPSPKGMMGGGPMINRSNSVPTPRSILHQQLMDMGMMMCLYTVHVHHVSVIYCNI